MNSNNSLSGRVALVTGSSKGIGQAIATELARRGANIILHGRRPSQELDDTLQRIKNEVVDTAAQVQTLPADFATESVTQFAGTAWNLFGKINMLVNNAGGDVLTGPQSELTDTEKLDLLYKIDCRATFELSRQIGRQMKNQSDTVNGRHSIINIGWDQAFQGMAGDSGEIFSAIKGSVMSMTLSLAQSLAPQVRVNCVAPGWIKTQWGQHTTDYWDKRARSESLMQRWGTPQDVANAVAFLVSDNASFVSGQILNVNGGYRFCQSPPDRLPG